MTQPETTREVLTPLLNSLDNRLRKIVELRFGLNSFPRTLEEIGAECGLNRERVRRIEAETLKQLRESARPALLKAVEQEASELRAALIDKLGEVRPEDLPSRYDLPWTDLALEVCGLSAEDWTSICVGEGSSTVT